MDAATTQMLDYVLTAPLGFYLKVDMLVRLLSSGNVAEIMERLPPDFRGRLVEFAREAYGLRPGVEMISIAGPPIPQSCVDALRAWIRSNDTWKETRDEA